MKHERGTEEQRHYITNNVASNADYHLYQKEKMELRMQLFALYNLMLMTKSVYINGKTIQDYDFVKEDITYMADYIINEKGEIETVVFDRVSVEHGRKASEK